VLAIDGPHVFATLSRTYLDDAERAARATLLRASLGFFASDRRRSVLSVLAGRRLPYDFFLTFASHLGVLARGAAALRRHVLYKQKAGDTARATTASIASPSTSACSRRS